MLERGDRYDYDRKRPRLSKDADVSGKQEAQEEDFARNHWTLSRQLSPPWRNDDRQGHYLYSLGENLTPRFKILRKMGEG